MKIGVLALQGDVPEHLAALEPLLPPGSVLPVRTPEDLAAVDALILPGGESTTIAALLEKTGLWRALSGRLERGLPVLATCAGLILLAKDLETTSEGRNPPTLGALDVVVRRNDYGAQRESFEGPVSFDPVVGAPYPGVFIRAPRIVTVRPGVTAVAHRDGEVVGVRRGPVVGLTFHPELSSDPRIHQWFLSEVVARAQPARASQTHTTRRAAKRTDATATHHQ